MTVQHLQFNFNGQILNSKTELCDKDLPAIWKDVRNNQTTYYRKANVIDNPLTFGSFLIALIAAAFFQARAIFDQQWRPWAESYWKQVKSQVRQIQCYEQLPGDPNPPG
jgi:hypothetical protein